MIDMVDTEKILRAKVDIHKTMMTISMGAGITSSIGYWVLPQDVRGLVGQAAILFLIGFLISLSFYINRHKKLIDVLFKE